MSVRSKAYPSPFSIPHNVRASVFVITIAYLLFCFLLIVVFKPQIRPYYQTDEGGYHNGGILLAEAIEKGEFVATATNKDLFKYPGYYSFIAGIYYFIGYQPIVIRLINVSVLILTAICIANLVCLLTGNRAFVLTFLITVLNPVFLNISLLIYRDIFVVLAIAIILHNIMCSYLLRFQWKEVASWTNILAYIILFSMRFPQGVITAIFHLFALTIVAPGKRRNYFYWILILWFVGLVALNSWQGNFIGNLISHTVFGESGSNETILETSGSGSVRFRTIENEIIDLSSPKEMLLLVFPRIGLFLNSSIPFFNEEIMSDLTSALSDLNYVNVGYNDCLEIYLSHGLHWIYCLLLLPFLFSGIIILYRGYFPIFVTFSILVLTYLAWSVVTINMRWSLPMNLVYCVVASLGYFCCGKAVFKYYPLLTGIILLSILVVGYSHKFYLLQLMDFVIFALIYRYIFYRRNPIHPKTQPFVSHP